MSVWSRIVELAQRAFDPEADPPDYGEECAPRPNDVGFTAAVIGLAAKMAKADGITSEAEMAAAAQVFRPPPGEETAFRRAFMLGQETVLGFDSYAKQIGRKYRARPCLLEDVLDGLFHIAGGRRAGGRSRARLSGSGGGAFRLFRHGVPPHQGDRISGRTPMILMPYWACCLGRAWRKCATPGGGWRRKTIPTA